MKRVMAVVIALGLGACGLNEGNGPGNTADANTPPVTGGDGGPGPSTASTLMPMTVGDMWEYQVTDSVTKAKLTKVSKVLEQKVIEGVDTWVMESITGASRSVVHLQKTQETVLRSREEEYRANYLLESKVQKPGSIRGLLVMPQAGYTFTEKYDEDYMKSDGSLVKTKDMTYDWVVDAVDESVTVPAGTFSAVKLRRIRSSNGKEKVLWLAPGVGKVKEIESGGDIEELVKFNLTK